MYADGRLLSLVKLMCGRWTMNIPWTESNTRFATVTRDVASHSKRVKRQEASLANGLQKVRVTYDSHHDAAYFCQ